MHRLSFTDAELAAAAEALREALAADLLTGDTRSIARDLLDRIDQKLPSAADRHPAGPTAGRIMAGDDILRLLLAREDRHGRAQLDNEAIGRELQWKPAGTSIRELTEDLRRNGWLHAHGTGTERRFALTRKGRGRVRALQHAGAAPEDEEARVREPDELLDLVYADCTPGANSFTGDASEQHPATWHRPTVQAAARLDTPEFDRLQTALTESGMLGEPVHAYGTLTAAGEQRARERWSASRPAGAFGGPPRPARPYRRARSVASLRQDRACPNCGAPASWLTRRATKRWQELRDRGEVDFTCPSCEVRWTIYLEPTAPGGEYAPLAEPAVCRPRWRYRGGWLRHDAPVPPEHHPYVVSA